jgi:hypothetical protein
MLRALDELINLCDEYYPQSDKNPEFFLNIKPPVIFMIEDCTHVQCGGRL